MRLFVALDIPEEVREALAQLVAQLRPACKTARWARVEGLHVTLKFIGEDATGKARNDQDGALLNSLPRAHPDRFSRLWIFSRMSAARVCFGPGSKPGQTSASLPWPSKWLSSRSASRATVAPFTPHLTLARFESPRGLDVLQCRNPQCRTARIRPDHCNGISSVSKRAETRRRGIYSAGNFFLCGGKTGVNPEMAPGAPGLWAFVVLGYLLGSIPFGYLLVRATGGGDIRFIGSGNIGATNVAQDVRLGRGRRLHWSWIPQRVF